jgi:hypothetical protein
MEFPIALSSLGFLLYLTLLAAVFVGAISGIGVGSLGSIDLVEALKWSWRRCWKRAAYGFIPGVLIGLIIKGVVDLARLEGSEIAFTWEESMELLRIGLLFGLICALTSGVAGGFIPKVMAEKTSPNQGIKLSTRSFIVVLFISWFIFGLVVWLTPVATVFSLPQTLFSGMALGLSLALITALSLGGSAVLKHYTLRLLIWLTGHTPFNFIKFLDHCAKLILVKKVGGGYIFIHRMLLEYFAGLTPEPIKTTGAK